jgi:hypothetical protein
MRLLAPVGTRHLVRPHGTPPCCVALHTQMWEAAVQVAADAMLEGFGRVTRCSLEGRAAMSLAPATAAARLRVVRVREQ